MSTFSKTPLDAKFYINYIQTYVCKHIQLEINTRDYTSSEIEILKNYTFFTKINTVVIDAFVQSNYTLSHFVDNLYFTNFEKSCEIASIYIYARMVPTINRIIRDELNTFVTPPLPKCPTCSSSDHLVCGGAVTIRGF
jgi:hypothetical protein